MHDNSPPATIVVSPRNAEKASKLSQKVPQVKVAESNQAVIDSCDIVFLAIRMGETPPSHSKS